MNILFPYINAKRPKAGISDVYFHTTSSSSSTSLQSVFSTPSIFSTPSPTSIETDRYKSYEQSYKQTETTNTSILTPTFSPDNSTSDIGFAPTAKTTLIIVAVLIFALFMMVIGGRIYKSMELWKKRPISDVFSVRSHPETSSVHSPVLRIVHGPIERAYIGDLLS